MLKLSIIISTYQRTKKLEQCLKSILQQRIKPLEVLVIDQNSNSQVKAIIKKINSPLIKYFNLQKIGLARARNDGVNLAKGEILVFTDDDCIVGNHWLKNIIASFNHNSEIIGLFGQVLPYQPKRNKDKICPCIFMSTKNRLIKKPCLHWQNIGFGNNMAFRRKIFAQVNGFKEWLGVGSIGKSAEDAEFALRCLLKGHQLLYNPKMVVYHNRWLSKGQYRQQCLSYSWGEVAAYGYFAFQGKKFAKKVVINNFKDSYYKVKKIVKKILLKGRGFKTLWYALEELYFRLRGLLVGFYFSKKDSL